MQVPGAEYWFALYSLSIDTLRLSRVVSRANLLRHPFVQTRSLNQALNEKPMSATWPEEHAF